MKTIYLRRLSLTESFDTTNNINSQLPLYVKIYEKFPAVYHIYIASNQSQLSSFYLDGDRAAAFARAAEIVSLLTEQETVISPVIEHFSYDRRLAEDRFLGCCFYHRDSDTIRLYPGDIPLAVFCQKGRHRSLQVMPGGEHYRNELRNAADCYRAYLDILVNPANEEEIKQAVAYFLGEQIKLVNNDIPVEIADRLIK